MIKYPHLLRYKHITPFWVSILERISINDAPFGSKIYSDKLIYYDEHIDLLKCTSDDIVNFFVNKIGINLTYIHFESWKDIKRKTIKDNLIQDYVQRLTFEYNLSQSKTNYLLSMIHLYITLKKITPDEIILETNYIDNFKRTVIKKINGISINGDIFFRGTISNQSQYWDDDEDD